jgi:hypothetical protein
MENGEPMRTAEVAKTVQIHNHGVYKTKSTEFEHLPNGSLAYPSYIQRARRLHIEVSFVAVYEEYEHGSSLAGSAAFTRACIHTLVSFLMEGLALQELKVRYNHKVLGRYNSRATLNALESLRRLRNVEMVNLSVPYSGSKIHSKKWVSMAEQMQFKTDRPPINILKKMQDIYHLCEGIAKHDDDDDLRKAEHELLKIFYRFIMWELHSKGSLRYFPQTQSGIAEHLDWMKSRIVKIRERDETAPQKWRGSLVGQITSSAASYWKVLGEAPAKPSWPLGPGSRFYLNVAMGDYCIMEDSCGSRETETLAFLMEHRL